MTRDSGERRILQNQIQIMSTMEDTMKIKVNGEPKVWPYSHISYEQLVSLAGMRGQHPYAKYHVYSASGVRSGIINDGDEVALLEGMSFRVAHTGNA
jgi:hypothetical protein